MRILVLGLVLLFALSCASSETKESEENGGIMDSLLEKAQSEEGQKLIKSTKEKLEEKETQDKIKGIMKKDKK